MSTPQYSRWPQRSGWSPPWSLALPGAVPDQPGAPRPDSRHGWRLLMVFAFAEVTFLAASLLVLLPFVLGSSELTADDPLPPAALVTALVVPTMLAAVVAIAGTALVGRGRLWQRLGHDLAVRWRPSDAGIGLGLGVASLAITLPASMLWARWVGEDQANSAVGEVFDGQRLGFWIAITVFFGVWLVAPLCEEVLYRGVLWRAMEYWGWNRWVILGLTTLVFSFAHLELLRTPLLVVISLPIALARMLTGNLLAGIVAHQANNFLPAVGLFLVSQDLLPA